MGIKQLTEPSATKGSVNIVIIIAVLIRMMSHIPRSKLSALHAYLFSALTTILLLPSDGENFGRVRAGDQGFLPVHLWNRKRSPKHDAVLLAVIFSGGINELSSSLCWDH